MLGHELRNTVITQNILFGLEIVDGTKGGLSGIMEHPRISGIGGIRIYTARSTEVLRRECRDGRVETSCNRIMERSRHRADETGEESRSLAKIIRSIASLGS